MYVLGVFEELKMYESQEFNYTKLYIIGVKLQLPYRNSNQLVFLVLRFFFEIMSIMFSNRDIIDSRKNHSQMLSRWSSDRMSCHTHGDYIIMCVNNENLSQNLKKKIPRISIFTKISSNAIQSFKLYFIMNLIMMKDECCQD